MKKLAIGLSILILVSIISFVIIDTIENESNYFSNYNELLKSDLMKKGWVPNIIPDTATNIREHHRVDNPYINVEFDFSPTDTSKFNSACEKASEKIYVCENNGHSVIVNILGENHAIIESLKEKLPTN